MAFEYKDMHFNIKLLAKECHQNSVDHGWWDDGDRPIDETISLIHSEWSEALEEARAGRGLIWYDEERHHKPEGIAVELIDGVIRILDYLGKLKVGLNEGNIFDISDFKTAYERIRDEEWSISKIVAKLHEQTSIAYSKKAESYYKLAGVSNLITAIVYALIWVYLQDIDAEALLWEKHDYNKTRPYKHGKKF